MKRECLDQIFEKYSDIKCQKIRPLEAELFHADKQTDMTKRILWPRLDWIGQDMGENSCGLF
jgi:hypothetical protein